MYIKNLPKIIKLQAIFRGYLVRRNMPVLMLKHKPSINSAGESSQKTVEYKDGSVYVGAIYNGKRQGYGQQTWPDGAQYTGYWENDMTNGKGKFKYPDGDSYDGDWKNDKANGYGEYVRVNGSKYVGEWQDDQQHGEGTETWPDGTKFVGYYINGIKNGKGSYYWEDGTKYEGDWKDNKIEGYVSDFINSNMCNNYVNRESIHGKMEGHMTESGKTIACTAKESIRGRMEEHTKDNTYLTRNMDMEFTVGLTEDDTKAAGRTESRTAKESISMQSKT